MNKNRLSAPLRVTFRLILLALLLIALLPAVPAAADGPTLPGRQSPATKPAPPNGVPGPTAGDVSASALSMSAKKVSPADGYDGDLFGDSIGVSGDLMVVGAPYAEVDGPNAAGKAYLYGRNVDGPGNWGLIKELTPSVSAGYNYFGVSVAIYGATAVVCALGRYDYQGACDVFEQDAGGPDAWGRVAELTGADSIWGDSFGSSVAIYGSLIVVGAFEADVDGNYDQGAAYIFGRNAGAWGQVKKLTASDGQENNYFGASAAIQGATIVVGATAARLGGYDDAGAAYVFGRDVGGAGAWGQFKKLVASDPAENAVFGYSVAVSGTTIVVGAPQADVGDQDDQGVAYVFERDQGGYERWGQLKKLIAPDGAAYDCFGASVAISGSAIVVGAPYADLNDGQYDAGVAYLFGRNTAGANAWGLLTRLVATTWDFAAYFGGSVALDNVTVAVGANEAYGTFPVWPGAAYVYVPYGMRVNVGGPKVTDTAGNLWLADRAWLNLGPVTWGYLNGIGRSVSTPINNTEDDKLYQTERLWSGSAQPGYRFLAPSGRYMLTFKYAETYWNAAGKRKFTVMAEGKICAANYDPYIAAGGARYTAAPDLVCYVNVNDGILDISFMSVAGQPKADAIYIQQLYQ